MTKDKPLFAVFIFPIIVFFLYCKAVSADSIHQDSERYLLSEKTCRSLFGKVIPSYRRLYKKLDKKYKDSKKKPVEYLLNVSPEKCQNKKDRQIIETAIGSHSNRVGIMLPKTTRPEQAYTRHMIQGIVDYLKKEDGRYTQKVIFKNTHGQTDTFHKKLAELIFVDEVSMIIGGANQQESALLEKWAERLKIPVIILRGTPLHGQVSNNLFFVSPNPDDMAKDILSFILERKLPRLAILHPTNQSNQLIAAMKQHAEAAKLPEIKTLSYSSHSYRSQEEALRKLFQLNTKDRAEEMAAKIESAKKSAVTEGVTFDPSQVQLDPIIDVDALFIFDNFKNTRFLIKILKYLGIPELPLLGTQQWRAEELLTPPEPFLNNSYFFDYMGSYVQLPFQIKYQGKNPWFTNFNQAESIDMQLIVMHALDASLRSLEKSPSPRYLLFKNLEKVGQSENKGFFMPGLVFNERHISRWPTFAFQLKENEIRKAQVINRSKKWQTICESSNFCNQAHNKATKVKLENKTSQ